MAPRRALASGQAITLTTVNLLDTINGWGIGGPAATSRYIVRTGDGGRTWRDVSPPGPTTVETPPVTITGYFADLDRAWVVYGLARLGPTAAPVVWRTTNGGETWEASAPLDTEQTSLAHFFVPSDVHFLADGQLGWFVAHLAVSRSHDFFTIYHTEDGGAHWQRVLAPGVGPQRCLKTDLQFTGAHIGWLTGTCQLRVEGIYFYATQDGGETWQAVTLPPPSGAPDMFERADANCGTRDLMFHSAEAGRVVVSCLMLSAEPLRTEAFIYTTFDGGATWTSNPAPARGTTWLDAQTGWSHPTQGTLTKPWEVAFTFDGGQTWEPLAAVEWYGPVDFVNPQTGWAVAYNGERIHLLHSVDGGRTWNALEPVVAASGG